MPIALGAVRTLSASTSASSAESNSLPAGIEAPLLSARGLSVRAKLRISGLAGLAAGFPADPGDFATELAWASILALSSI